MLPVLLCRVPPRRAAGVAEAGGGRAGCGRRRAVLLRLAFAGVAFCHCCVWSGWLGALLLRCDNTSTCPSMRAVRAVQRAVRWKVLDKKLVRAEPKRAMMEGQTLTVTLTADDKPNQPCRRKVDGTDIVFTAPPHAREGITYDLTIAGMRNGTAIAISKNNPFMSSSLGGFEAAVVGAAVEAAANPPHLNLPPPPAPAPARTAAASAFGSVAASRDGHGAAAGRRRAANGARKRAGRRQQQPAVLLRRPFVRAASGRSSGAAAAAGGAATAAADDDGAATSAVAAHSAASAASSRRRAAIGESSPKGGRGVLLRRRRHRKQPPLIINKAARPLREAARHLTLRAALLALPLRAARPTRSI